MTQAAGMYNTLLQSDDPGLVIEPLNGYRIKERLPDHITLHSLILRETGTSYASWYASDNNG